MIIDCILGRFQVDYVSIYSEAPLIYTRVTLIIFSHFKVPPLTPSGPSYI